jgi:hypothetical protein
MNRITQLAVGALAVLAVGPAAAAQADSIVYVKDANVWLSTSDGSRHHQVTSTGGYSFASQSDDGTIVALNADRHLHRIDRVSGAVTADFSTPVSDTPPNSNFIFQGPYSPTISPDGKKVAYGYSARYILFDPYCGYPGGCSEGKTVVGTGYTNADRMTPWDEPGFKQHSGWQWPSWLDNEHAVISGPWELGNLAVWVDTFGDDAFGREWFGITANGAVYETEVNRQQSAVVSVASTGKFLDIERMDGPWPGGGMRDCLFVGDREGPTYQSPSWSPDGTRLAYSDGSSVQILSNVDMTGCNWDAPVATRLDAGLFPDWGPADVPPVRAVTVDPPRADARRDGPNPCAKRCNPDALRNPLGAKVTTASVGRGVTVKFTAPAAGRLSASATFKRKTIGSGVKKVTRTGGATVTLRFTRAGKKALKQGGKVTIRLTFKPARGAIKKATIDTQVKK